jgi:hypothetical protein
MNNPKTFLEPSAPTLKTIGKCIYCGSIADLSREHIVPLGLGGRWLLLKASCRRCGAITSQFEQNVLRNLWGPARAALNLPTRRNHKTTYPIEMESNGIFESKEIDAKTFGFPLVFPHFEGPAYLSGKANVGRIAPTGHTVHVLPSMQHFAYSIRARFKPRKIQHKTTYRPIDFAKFLAKIAYGFTVLQLGLDSVDEVYVLEAILGRKDDIGNWVGCHADATELSQGTGDMEARLFFLNTQKRDILVEIKMFCRLNSPTYLVVVGKPSASATKGVIFPAQHLANKSAPISRFRIPNQHVGLFSRCYAMFRLLVSLIRQYVENTWDRFRN